MNVIHVISSIDRDAGGPSTYLEQLTRSLANHAHINVATLKSAQPVTLAPQIGLFYFNKSLAGFNAYSSELKFYCYNVKADIFHGNGLWQFPVHLMAKAARKRKIPYIISTHGMLNPEAYNIKKLKKAAALSLFQKNDIKNASCIHATSTIEAKYIRGFGIKKPIAVIPNGIDLENLPLKSQDTNKGAKTLLFLSRIHPVKGVGNLIEAWSQVDKKYRDGWQLKIIGIGSKKYINYLRTLVSKMQINDCVTISGPRFGNEKINALHEADLFVLPSITENFGIVVTEAMACGLPVITTKGTPWEELNNYNAGWWTEADAGSLAETLSLAIQKTDRERVKMGINGRKLVEEKYDIKIVSNQMLGLYNWILNGGNKPGFVLM